MLSATPVRCVTERQDGNLSFNFYTGAVLPNGGTETYTAAADANGLRAASDHYTFATVTTLTYDGATTGDYNDPATLSATLIRNAGSVPIVGATVTFDLDGVETCSGTTNASGRASCQVTPGEAAGSYTVHASFAGAGPDLAVSTSSPFMVTLEDTQLTLAPTSFLANGLELHPVGHVDRPGRSGRRGGGVTDRRQVGRLHARVRDDRPDMLRDDERHGRRIVHDRSREPAPRELSRSRRDSRGMPTTGRPRRTALPSRSRTWRVGPSW